MYKIIIEKTEEVMQTQGQDWAVIGQEENGSGKVVDAYGYTPSIEKTKTVNTKVYEQAVDELNLSTVIKAVNEIE